MKDWWNRRPKLLRWSTAVAIMTGVILATNFQGAMTKAAAAMPVLWFQIIDYIDARSAKRDQQMDLVRQDAITADLTGIGNLKQILNSRILDLDMRLRITPNDRVLLDAKAAAKSDFDEAERQEHIKQCRLSLLTNPPGGDC